MRATQLVCALLCSPMIHLANAKARPNQAKATKYFHEAGPTLEQGHYDGRFFKGLLSYEDQRPELRRTIRAYLTIFRALGVETWLAHGTLLGWWWNGQIMPWDDDLDVQVSSATLQYMAQNLNQTLHEYRYLDEETGKEATRTYMLDVNPNYGNRLRGDGQNVIDARWIDTANGKFVDITGLAERNPEAQPGIWSCKNYHRYRSRDLYPMRETEFEGVAATVPYAFDKVLTDEYGVKSLVTTQWKGHRWIAELKQWVRTAVPTTTTSIIPVATPAGRVA